MSRGYPSMTALLGLLAVAGYQNRDKITEWLGSGSSANANPAGQPASGNAGLSGLLGSLTGALGGAGAGGLLSGGLNELAERFQTNGHGDTAQSWIGPGANKEIAPGHLEQAIGPDVLQTIAQHTGLSKEDLLARLSKNLPQAIDQYTPDGRVPA